MGAASVRFLNHNTLLSKIPQYTRYFLNRRLHSVGLPVKSSANLLATGQNSQRRNCSNTVKQREELIDPFCDPYNPRQISYDRVSEAVCRIHNGIIHTPCSFSPLSNKIGMEIYCKKEFMQLTASYKERGARNALMMLDEETKKVGVFSASSGNHALAISYHGFKLGIPVTVVMPTVSSVMKITGCRKFKANVILKGKDIAESKTVALQLAKEKGGLYINGYDHPNILAGAGSVAVEVLEQIKHVDAIIVPVGGGGLLAGTCVAIKTLCPNIKVIGVESENCPSFSHAMKTGKPQLVKCTPSLADGLAVPCVGYNSFETAKCLIDRMVLVKEEWIAKAMLYLLEYEKSVIEGAGATGIAAILSGQLNEYKGKRVVAILTGGNVDTVLLMRVIDRALAMDRRLIKAKVRVNDRQGGIADFCKLLTSAGVSILNIAHERAWLSNDAFSVEVSALCETRDSVHVGEVKQMLTQKYKSVTISGCCQCSFH